MIVTIHQPHYMPWLGYFDKMDRADVFIFLDTVQFKKNEFQNRNKIKGADGGQWLTVPVRQNHGQKIGEVIINNTVRWQKKHRMSLRSCYRSAPFFEDYFERLEPLLAKPWERLADLNIACVKLLASLLAIDVRFAVASELEGTVEDRDRRLVELTKAVGGDTYLAGGAGKDYMDLSVYERAKVRVTFHEFSHPTYPQLFGPFISNLSVIDLLFNAGEKSLSYIRGKAL
jgi:hypothetical protein